MAESPPVSPLLQALKDGQPTGQVRLLINEHTVNVTDESGISPLSLCFQHEHGGKFQRMDVAKMLFAAGANPNVKLRSDELLFHVACRQTHSDWIKLLVANNVDLNTRDKLGRTPLHELFTGGNKDKIAELARFLIAKGANALAVDDDGKTIFQAALQAKKLPATVLATLLPVPEEEYANILFDQVSSIVSSGRRWGLDPVPAVRTATESVIMRLLHKHYDKTSSPAVSSATLSLYHLIHAWLSVQPQVNPDSAQEMLDFCFAIVTALPQTMPLFIKIHKLVLSRSNCPSLLPNDTALATASPKQEMVLMLSHLYSNGKPITQASDRALGIVSMEESSWARSGHFSSPDFSGVPLESAPDDVLMEIILRCHYDTDIGSIACVSKTLNAKISSMSTTQWRKLFDRFNVDNITKDEQINKKVFVRQVSRRRSFRVGWDLANVRKIRFSEAYISADCYLKAIPNRDGIFALSAETSSLSIMDVRNEDGKLAKRWEDNESTFYHPDFSTDGNRIFFTSRENGTRYLCSGATDPADDSPLTKFRVDQIDSATEEDICPIYGRIQLMDHSGSKILQNPGMFFDVGNGALKHTGTLNWPLKVDHSNPEEGEYDLSSVHSMDRADWSAFAFRKSNPNRILARYLYYSWFYDTRASFDPVLTFPTTQKRDLERATFDHPLQMKTDTIVRINARKAHIIAIILTQYLRLSASQAWSIDKFGNLLEYDLRNMKVSKLQNLTCGLNRALPQDLESVAFTFTPCLDAERSLVFASFLYGTVETFVRWNLSSSIPEVGVLQDGPAETNHLGVSAMSESFLAVSRSNAGNPEILVCPF